MADIKKKTTNGKEITIVEDGREDLRNFLDEAQEIEQLDESGQKKALEEIFGSEEQNSDKKKEDGKQGREQKEGEGEAQAPPPRQAEAAEKFQKTYESRTTNSARANSDVALAMAVACQAAEEAAADSPCYVVHGAKAMCSMGSRQARLVVPLDYGVLLKEKPQMVIDDYRAPTNVKCFGNCFSAENPNMKEEAVNAANQYNQSKPQTFWGKVKALFVKPKEVEEVSDELKAACICECTPLFVEPWMDGAEKNQIDEKEALIQTGILVCEYGGIVRIMDNGQDG